ncbi:MAG: hypothetical protein K8H84_13685, partial [Sulfuricella denitrificans]|nr:hypothetical protein [Sulfuricella denitrificans]
MGRLFWKFFFFIWLAQLSAILATATTFWLEHSVRNESALVMGRNPPPDPEFRPEGRPSPRDRPPH